VDIVCWLLPVLRAFFALQGRYDESLGLWEKSLQRGEEVNHAGTKQFMSLIKLVYKHRLGDHVSIMEAQRVMESLQIPTLKALAKLFSGVTLIESSKSKEDQMEGLQIVQSAGRDIESQWGEHNGGLLVDTLILVH